MKGLLPGVLFCDPALLETPARQQKGPHEKHADAGHLERVLSSLRQDACFESVFNKVSRLAGMSSAMVRTLEKHSA